MFPGYRTTGGDACRHDLRARGFDALLELRISGVERNVGMQITVAGVKDVADHELVVFGDRADRFEDVRERGARHDGILYDEVARQSAHRAERLFASLPQ